MLRVILLIFVYFFAFTGLVGQVKKFYSLENDINTDKLNIVLTATSNSCCIKPTVNPNLVNVFGYDTNPNPVIYSETEMTERIQHLIINLNNTENDEETSLTKRFFSTSNNKDNHWDLYLSNEKPMRLYLNYAVGDAEVDLSELPIEKLKISSGSAEVTVGYMENKPNVLMVQSGQFLESGRGRVAYVVRDDLAYRTRIQTGSRSLSSVEITQGLKPGDQIIISSTQQFKGAESVLLTQ